MPFHGQPCPSCGGKELVRRQSAFACAFCGARIVPRLEPGTLCADAEGGFCSHPAESLCRACSRPLCDRHNDPRRLYWHAKLDWSVLCPGWKTADRTEWARLNAALPRFPAPDIEPPFEWHRFEKESRQAVGGLEHEMPEAVRPLARECDESSSIPADFLETAWELGLTSTQIPETYGGAGEERSPVTNALVLEELAHGDAALAIAAVTPSLFANAVLDDPRFIVDEVPLLALVRHALPLGWTRDPFDRLLVAHSTARRTPLCTPDRSIHDNHALVPRELMA